MRTSIFVRAPETAKYCKQRRSREVEPQNSYSHEISRERDEISDTYVGAIDNTLSQESVLCSEGFLFIPGN